MASNTLHSSRPDLISPEVLYELLRRLPVTEARFMEVCGTHTVTIFRSGIRQTILRETNVELISGPGCPVCVTAASEIDQVAQLALENKDIILTSYGDLFKVRGGRLSFAESREKGADVRLVISPLDNLNLARKLPNKKILFFSTGFETTQPGIAHTILMANEKGIKNFLVYVSHKLIIPVLKVLLDDSRLALDGFILPGHVSTIIGEEPYSFIADVYKKGAVIAGFEAEDVLYAVYHLLRMKIENKPRVINIYRGAVRRFGNKRAQEIINEVFDIDDAYWRGIGLIKNSGHRLRAKYRDFDASEYFGLERAKHDEHQFGHCRCGEVLLGLITPLECQYFGNACKPENPLGACMVSSEGSCSTYYRYGERK